MRKQKRAGAGNFMMNASLYGSIVRPSPVIPERYVPCISPRNPNRFRKESKCISSRLSSISALSQELGLVSSNDVSLQSSVIKTTEPVQEEEKEELLIEPGIDSEVSGITPEDKAFSSPIGAKKKKEEQDSYDNRFTIRNGREVFNHFSFFFFFFFPPFLTLEDSASGRYLFYPQFVLDIFLGIPRKLSRFCSLRFEYSA